MMSIFKQLEDIFIEHKTNDKADDKADNEADDETDDETDDKEPYTTDMPDLENEESAE